MTVNAKTIAIMNGNKFIHCCGTKAWEALGIKDASLYFPNTKGGKEQLRHELTIARRDVDPSCQAMEIVCRPYKGNF